MIVKMKGGTVTNSKTIDQLFDEYVESRRLALSNSWYYGINRNYEKHLKNLIGKMFPQEVKSQDIQKIINDMLQGNNEKKKKYKPSTVKQIKDCMSGLYDYLKKSGIDVRNIGRELVIPSFDNKIYFTISDEKAQKLFDVILNYKELKWRAYFVWLLHGRRKMEVAEMRWEWVDFDSMTYRIPAEISKTSKDVIAPLTELLKDVLEKYGVKNDGFIFEGNGDSGFISATGIDFQWRNIRSFAGLPKMRLHDIRHLVGYMGVNSGYTLEMIGAVLGHRSTVTTKRYSNMKSDSAKEVLSGMFDRFVK
jgi:integrase